MPEREPRRIWSVRTIAGAPPDVGRWTITGAPYVGFPDNFVPLSKAASLRSPDRVRSPPIRRAPDPDLFENHEYIKKIIIEHFFMNFAYNDVS